MRPPIDDAKMLRELERIRLLADELGAPEMSVIIDRMRARVEAKLADKEAERVTRIAV